MGRIRLLLVLSVLCVGCGGHRGSPGGDDGTNGDGGTGDDVLGDATDAPPIEDRPACSPADPCGCRPCPVKIEADCTDGRDDDGDGLPDQEDGDCWFLDGAILTEELDPIWQFGELESLLPELCEIGVKTIEPMAIWKPTSANSGDFRHFVRWLVQDYGQLDSERGTWTDLADLLAAAHTLGLRVVPMFELAITAAPNDDCVRRLPGGIWPQDLHDTEGLGGHYYRIQEANPEKAILQRNGSGEYACHGPGWGYSPDTESLDFVDLVAGFYRDQITGKGFDGVRLDANTRVTCLEGEYLPRTPPACGVTPVCPDPVPTKRSPLPLLRTLRQLKGAGQVFLAEIQNSDVFESQYLCTYPYYAADPDIDEVADATEGYELARLLFDIGLGLREISSRQLVEWVRNEPVYYGRRQIRMIRNWNGLDRSFAFIATDPRYYAAVTLAATLPGVPSVSHYELFGSGVLDALYFGLDTNNPAYPNNLANPPAARAAHWKKVLGIRNRSQALKFGSITDVWKGGGPVYAYSRDFGGEHVVVVVNLQMTEAAATLDLTPLAGVSSLRDGLGGATVSIQDPADVVVTVPPAGALILLPQ